MKGLCHFIVWSALGAASLSAQSTGGVNAPAQRAKPYVILVSFDGMKAEYLERLRLPNFERVETRGVRSRGMIPAFPSKTFPNHYSIATGMYTETHGLVANWFWDPQRRATYGMNDTAGTFRDGTWYRGEPIWVTAEKQGMVSASYFWPGSEADIEGVRPSIYKPFDGHVPNSARVDSVLAWLALGEAARPHMITLYFADADAAGHAHGPLSFAVDSATARLDTVLGRLIDGLDRLPFKDRIYLMLVSDHGMTETSPRWFAALDTLIDMRGVRLLDGGPSANLYVEGGRARAEVLRDSINRRMRFGRAYLRGDLPAHLHYNKDPRIGDLVVVMNEHFQIGMASKPPDHEGGSHGWDPTLPSMHAIFVASGPGIPAGRIIPAFENIDVYPYMTELLGLTPAKGIDGRPGRLKGLITGGSR
jgi:predicted AlkP superfamily pyrophosphatase or phosphodiesterase